MRDAEAWLAALALSLTGCGDGGSPGRAEIYEPSPDCSLRTRAAWQEFLATAAHHPEWTTTCSDLDNCDELLGDFNRRVQTEIVDVVSRCEADLDAYPILARCSSRLRHFVGAWQRQHTSHSYGFDQPNVDYFADQTAADKPAPLMELPAELRAALPDGDSIERVARERGWPYLMHDSALGGTRYIFNLTEARGAFERWFVFEVDPTTRRAGNSIIVSFIGLETPKAEPPRPHFRDYLLQADTGWAAQLPLDFGGKCYACHPSGLRQLLPSAGNVTEALPVRGDADFGRDVDRRQFGLTRLAAFNEHIASFSPPDWESSLETADHGPALGSSLGCPACHDGKTRGALSVMTSEGMLWQKVVGQLSMGRAGPGQVVPDRPAMSLLERLATGAVLSETETRALEVARSRHERDFRDLASSRSTDLEQWLLEVGCQ